MKPEMGSKAVYSPPADPHEEVHALCRGRVEEVAGRLGIPFKTLDRQLREEDKHKLSLRRAVAITQMLDSDVLAQSCASLRGKVLVSLPDMSNVSDAALLECWTKMMSEFGDFSTAFHKALEGGITAEEMARIDAEHRQFVAASLELTNRMRQLVPPPALKAVPKVAGR